MEKPEYWDRRAAMWSMQAAALAAGKDPYGSVALDVLAIGDCSTVLDIGCGPASTTIEIASRVAPQGAVVGIDLSSAMVAAARHRVEAAELAGRFPPGCVTVRVGDAQTDPLGTDFDAAFSRFGVMFFDDPPAAFANIASALRPGATFAFVAWGPIDDNPWFTAPTEAAADVLGIEVDPSPADVPGAFSLGDPTSTGDLLTSAGFAPPTVIDVTEPRRLSHDHARDELEVMLRMGLLGDAIATADRSAIDEAVDAALSAVSAYRDPHMHGGWAMPALARAYLTHRA